MNGCRPQSEAAVAAVGDIFLKKLAKFACNGSKPRAAPNFPLSLVSTAPTSDEVRVQRNKPSPFNEDLRQVQDRFLVPDGARPPGVKLPRGDGGLRPVVYEPVQELFSRRRVYARLLRRWVVREQVVRILFVIPRQHRGPLSLRRASMARFAC